MKGRSKIQNDHVQDESGVVQLARDLHGVAPPWEVILGEGPILATAIHNGHDVRKDVATLIAATDDDRRREEDPYTAEFTRPFASRLIVHRSRFELDLNRPRERTVYRGREEAFGLELWKEDLPAETLRRTRKLYDAFYSELHHVVSGLLEVHRHVLTRRIPAPPELLTVRGNK